MKRDNEELSLNQTRLQHECSTCETDNIKQQSLISGLQTELLSLTKSVSAIQPGDVKLNLLNSTIQALHIVHSSTAVIVTSLQGKQKTMDGNINILQTSLDHLRGSVGIDLSYLNASFIQLDQHILSLNASLRTLHGNVGIDVAAFNSSLMKLDQHVKNLNINVNKNTNGNNNCTYSCKAK